MGTIINDDIKIGTQGSDRGTRFGSVGIADDNLDPVMVWKGQCTTARMNITANNKLVVREIPCMNLKRATILNTDFE